MKRLSWNVSKYIIKSIVPYFAFTWLLLSVILFVQQAGRYTDIFFNATLPVSLVWQLTTALIPNVIAFTCPMAVLIGVIIGLSKMQGDSELVAIRAAGVGNFHITLPVLVLGILLSIFAFAINLKGVPIAAQIVRYVAVQTALYKLQSPIEPGTFNTEVKDYTIYVKNGDVDKGTWKNVFIYNEKAGLVRLITSTGGKVDTNDEKSELVLDKAAINTFSTEDSNQKLSSESVDNLRFVIQSKRKELLDKLSKTEETPEELGLVELLRYAQDKEGAEKIEAEILFQRRLVLSVTPLIFALLGAALVLRFNRGGRGWGIVLALASLVGYYLVALLGEQLARTNSVNVFVSSLLPILLTSGVIFWFFLSQRLFLTRTASNIFSRLNFEGLFKKKETSKRSFFTNLTTGILDFDIVTSLLRYFFLTLAFLTVIYVIFTVFELWKFAGVIDNGFKLLFRYIIYLIPFVYVQIAPSALMIATLATYVIKSRQNEIVTWTAAGQSIYRLLLPCFVLMMFIGLINWGLQETYLPNMNKIQDTLRTQIRNKGTAVLTSGRNWIANENNIYSFELVDASKPLIEGQTIKNLNMYQLNPADMKLATVIKAPEASWQDGKIKLLSEGVRYDWVNNTPRKSIAPKDSEIPENYNPFKQIYRKPSHLTTKETAELIAITNSETERRTYSVALQKRYTTPFLPLIITLFTAPFALSLSRKGRVITVGYAVSIWLLFMGVTNIFEQYGVGGYLDARVAVWSPLVLFTILGFFLMSKIKT